MRRYPSERDSHDACDLAKTSSIIYRHAIFRIIVQNHEYARHGGGWTSGGRGSYMIQNSYDSAAQYKVGTAFSHRGGFQDRPIRKDNSGTLGTESLVFRGLTCQSEELKSRVLQYPPRNDSNR